jgi:hypothetical protein
MVIEKEESKIHFKSALILGIDFTYEEYLQGIKEGNIHYMYRISLN